MMRVTWMFALLIPLAALGQAPPKQQPAEYTIAGVVLDATSGQSLPGARVSLGSTEEGRVPDHSVLTGPDGRFAFAHLAADKYQMYAEAVGYPLQGFEQHEAPYLTGVVVGPDISADQLVFKLHRGSVISGTLIDEFNEPVRNATVMLWRRGLDFGKFETRLINRSQTEDQGSFKFAGLLPGKYLIAVSARPWYMRSATDQPKQDEAMSTQMTENMRRLNVAFPLTFYPGVTDESRASEIALRDGDRVTADIAMRTLPAAQIRIPNSAEPGKPTGSLRLMQTAFGNDILEQQYEQRGSPDAMLLTGVAPGHYEAHYMNPNRSDGERMQGIDVSGDMTIDPEAIGETATVAIKGLAQMSNGEPLSAEAMVMLVKVGTNFGHPGNIDSKGVFAIDELQPGTYEVSLSSPNRTFILAMASSNAKVNGRRLTLTGASPVNLALELGKGMGQVHGVALRGDKGLGGTMVLLIPDNPGANKVLFRRDQSDSDGTFALPQVVPGRYSLVAIDGGWDMEWSKPAVLKPYLEKAEKIEVVSGGKYNVKVQVQQAK
jgi:Carboxypeptidase regulatory-like domain